MQRDSRLYSLDAVRGVAALLVVVFHYAEINRLPAFPGYLAVDLFFVLSGFVIAMNYLPRLRAGLGLQAFTAQRLERLYPLWLLGCLVALAHLVWTGEAARMPRWLAAVSAANMLMLPAPAQSSIFPLNMPGWSLFFELAVNMAFAAGLWKLGKRPLAAIMVAAGLCLIGITGPPDFVNHGATWSTIFGGVPRTVFSFLAGVLVFELAGQSAGGTGPRRSTPLALIPVAAAVIAILWAPPSAWRGAAELLRVLLLFPLLVWLAVRWECPGILKSPARWLGDLSYPVYVLHVPLMFLGDMARQATGSIVAGLMLYIVMLVFLAVPAAWADAAVRQWLRRRRRGERRSGGEVGSLPGQG